MVWYTIHPFIQGRIQLCNSILLPLWTDIPQQDFGSVYGVLLYRPVDTQVAYCKQSLLTIVRNANTAIWFNFENAQKKLTTLGLPGGCLKAKSGSELTQNSSSTSVGKSRSKLNKEIVRTGN
jgi:hypothetical protein